MIMVRLKTGQKIFIGFSVVLMIVIIVCFIVAYRMEKPLNDAQKVFLTVAEQVVIEPEKTDSEANNDVDANFLKEIDFDYLTSVNSDVKCWLYIPDTIINYPVMQENTVGEYSYLWTGLDKKWNGIGSLFTPAEPYDSAKDAHMLIFGHETYNGSMFGTLNRTYRMYDSMAEHEYAYLYYPDRVEKYKIALSKNIKSDDEVYELPYTFGASNYAHMIDGLKNNTVCVNDDTNLDEYKETLVLSTCRTNAGSTARFVAVFVKVDIYNY